jgi:hypothetical protein
MGANYRIHPLALKFSAEIPAHDAYIDELLGRANWCMSTGEKLMDVTEMNSHTMSDDGMSQTVDVLATPQDYVFRRPRCGGSCSRSETAGARAPALRTRAFQVMRDLTTISNERCPRVQPDRATFARRENSLPWIWVYWLQ